MRTPRQKTVTTLSTICLLRESALAHRVNVNHMSKRKYGGPGKDAKTSPFYILFVSVFLWDHIPSYSHSYEYKMNNLYF